MQWLTRLILLVAVIAALLLLMAGPGTRLELWHFRTGFSMMRWAVYLGLGAGTVAVIALLVPVTKRAHSLSLALALAFSVIAVSLPFLQYRQAMSVPRIHDITTDTVDPPAFVAILPLRADAPNPPEHEGEEVASKQREAYPDIASLATDAHAAIVFEHALAIVEMFGWEVAEASLEQGRIEATATTFWFGFKDDVVIRIRASEDGSVVDMRSKSRVGLSDVGANAARIRRFMNALDERLH